VKSYKKSSLLRLAAVQYIHDNIIRDRTQHSCNFDNIIRDRFFPTFEANIHKNIWNERKRFFDKFNESAAKKS